MTRFLQFSFRSLPRFVCKNNGVLFENQLLQIGLKSEFRQNLGKNKIQSVLITLWLSPPPSFKKSCFIYQKTELVGSLWVSSYLLKALGETSSDSDWLAGPSNQWLDCLRLSCPLCCHQASCFLFWGREFSYFPLTSQAYLVLLK